jgi:hypothetical protein
MRGARAGAALVCVLAFGDVRRAGADPSDRLIRYDKDTLTVRLTKAPLGQVVEEIGKQAAAEIRGRVREEREVSAEFEAVPIAEALHRLLGDQNFALVYGDHGQLRAIKLLGGPQAPVVAHAAPPATVSASPPPPLDFATVIQRHAPIPLTGRLAQALGRDSATLLDIMNAGLRFPDQAVRSEAVRLTVQTVEGDAEIRNAMLAAMNSVDDVNLAAMLRGMGGDHGEEFLIQAASVARSGDLRIKASSVLQQFRLQSREEGADPES